MNARYGIPLLLLALIAVVWITTPLVPIAKGYDSDGLRYGSMAGEFKGLLAQVAPFCWRVLTPVLARILPFDTLTNFKILALVSSYLTLLLLFHLLLALGFSKRVALIGVLFYAGVFWTVKFALYSPAYIDDQTQLFIVLILYLMVKERYGLAIPAIALGVLQKESIIALAAVVYAHRAAREGWFAKKPLLHAAGMILPAAAALILVRLLITPQNENYSPLILFYNFKTMLDTELWPRFLQSLFSGLGLIPLILLYRPKQVIAYLKAHPEWLVLILIGTVFLFGGIDKSRLFLYMLPGLVVCAAHVVDSVYRDRPAARVHRWVALTLLLHFYLGNYLTPLGSFKEYMARMVCIHVKDGSYLPYLQISGIACAVWIGSTYFLLRSRTP